MGAGEGLVLCEVRKPKGKEVLRREKNLGVSIDAMLRRRNNVGN